MPPTGLSHPVQHTLPHTHTHPHRADVNLTVSRKVFNHSKWSFAPFSLPTFPPPPPLYANRCILLLRIHRSSHYFLTLFPLWFSFTCNPSSCPFQLLVSLNVLSYHFLFPHSISSSIPRSRTLTQNLSGGFFFLISAFLPYKRWKDILSSSVYLSILPSPTPSQATHTHFWLWASDTHLFVSCHKGLKDPQMCVPLQFPFKKKKEPPLFPHHPSIPVSTFFPHTHEGEMINTCS